MTSRWGVVEEWPQSSTRTMATDWDEEEVAGTTDMYVDPQPYNFEPNRRERSNEELPTRVLSSVIVTFYLERGN